MARKGQKFHDYSPELKKQIVLERLENHKSFLELAYTYHISSQESIMQWVKRYQKYGDEAFIDKRGTSKSSPTSLKGRPRKKFNSEEEKDAYMKLLYERAKKKNAEKRRLIRIRKKRAAKRAEREASYKFQ